MADTVTEHLFSRIRSGEALSAAEQLALVVRLAIPAILSQFATVFMNYIDAAMVGNLGAVEAAAVGIVGPTTWLFWGLGSAGITGYSVLASHRIGAKDFIDARKLLRQGLTVALFSGLVLAAAGLLICGGLPAFLGAKPDVQPLASLYFGIYTAAMPLLFVSYSAGSMLRASGNIKAPSMLNILMCVEDVIFNFFLIFPTREVEFLGVAFTAPGAGLGVAGAALGTVLAEAATMIPMVWLVCARSPVLAITGEKGRFLPEAHFFRSAFRIGIPVGCERTAMCVAQVLSTMIVAPLGTIAVAAHSLAITAEGLCYMPGYGVSEAATTLSGQCTGAKRPALGKRIAWISVATGMAIMTVMGAAMYVFAAPMMDVMTNDAEILELGARVLRIEAFAEPMFAAAIVCHGIFVGAGDTLAPCLMNLGSMWFVRLPLAWLLASTMGLPGVWIAMCGELFFRGAMFLIRLRSDRWQRTATQITP